jgi:hypothetical protein
VSSPIEDPRYGRKSGSLAVRIAPPPAPVPAAVLAMPARHAAGSPAASPAAPRSAATPRPVPRPPAPAPAPKILALERSGAKAAPPAAEAPRALLGGDLAAYVAARRRNREPAPAATAPAETQQERDNRITAENLGLTRTPAFGAERERGGGIFHVQRIGVDDAEFFFYGWNRTIRRNTRQMIEVQRGSNPTIQIAVVRRMIAIIREYVKEDFTWESQRLKRDVRLSARPADNAGLEDFMMGEFFPEFASRR